MALKLIGIGGVKGAGKNTAAEVLRDEYGFKEISFAMPLKKICANATGLDYDLFDSQHHKDQPFPGGPVILRFTTLQELIKYASVYGKISGDQAELIITTALRRSLNTPREMLQYVGTQLFRELVDREFWTKAFTKEAQKRDKVVVPDVRFPNEREVIRKLGGAMILIEREGHNSADSHASETSLGHPSEYDFQITNDGTISKLHTNISNWYSNNKGTART
jgi:hypothetical protein